jgi:predicted outer membrane repeat protein
LVEKALTFEGIPFEAISEDKVFINPRRDSRAFRIRTSDSNAEVIFKNLSFINGNASEESGGALAIESGTVKLTNCEFMDNEATNGGAIFNQGSLALYGCTLSSNSATQRGGAIVSESASLEMTNCALLNNSSDCAVTVD